MMIETSGAPMDARVLTNYLDRLVGKVYKILPLWEESEPTLATYMIELLHELSGCYSFVTAIKYDSQFLSLLSTLQYLIDNPDSEVSEVKRMVFGAITYCKRLKGQYTSLTGINHRREV